MPNTRHGGTGLYQCKDGFILKGQNTTKCDFGNWTGETPICELVYCPFPGYIEGGKVMLPFCGPQCLNLSSNSYLFNKCSLTSLPWVLCVYLVLQSSSILLWSDLIQVAQNEQKVFKRNYLGIQNLCKNGLGLS